MAKKKIFFDLEFTGLHKLTTPISIGLVSEDGDKFYAEFTDYDKFQIDNFLKNEVLSKLTLQDYNFEKDYDPDAKEVYVKGDIDVVFSTMNLWFMKFEDEEVEMWGDVLAYDWVLFINIFGNGLALPKFIDYIPMDLATILPLCGIDKDVNRDEFAYGEEAANSRKDKKHNSLHDAETQLEVYNKIISLTQQSKNDAEVSESEEEVSEQKEEIVEEAVQQTELEDETFVKEEDSKPAKKKQGRGRPKKEVKPANSSNKAVKEDGFIEPTQEDVNSTAEWNTPI